MGMCAVIWLLTVLSFQGQIYTFTTDSAVVPRIDIYVDYWQCCRSKDRYIRSLLTVLSFKDRYIRWLLTVLSFQGQIYTFTTDSAVIPRTDIYVDYWQCCRSKDIYTLTTDSAVVPRTDIYVDYWQCCHSKDRYICWLLTVLSFQGQIYTLTTGSAVVPRTDIYVDKWQCCHSKDRYRRWLLTVLLFQGQIYIYIFVLTDIFSRLAWCFKELCLDTVWVSSD